MYNPELKDIKKQNFESKLTMIKETIIVYIKCLIFYPTNKELRDKLIKLMKGFFIGLKNEEEILQKLDGAYLSEEEIEEILNYLDELYLDAWFYYDGVLEDFETIFEVGDLHRVMYQNEVVKSIDENKKHEIMKRILDKEKNNN